MAKTGAVPAYDRPIDDLAISESPYLDLPARFYAAVTLDPVSQPAMIQLNEGLAEELGLDTAILNSPAGLDLLAGNRGAAGARPVALAYAGHQFGNLVPQLGDGRALLLGEVQDRSGRAYDLQLKGSGPTVFSRGGDGRAAIGPVLREYLVSEAMAAFGVPTTRSLAAVSTGEPVFRETRLPGAVLARVATSHIRIGTFQYFAIRDDVEAVRLLADYAIDRHYADLGDQPDRYARFLERVIAAQADLVAKWMLLGFIHGVMNTDNMSIAGETIDYGPCAFMDAYDPTTVFSSIDQMGRYAYANQPRIAVWNLARFAETLLPLLSENEETAIKSAEDSLGGFQARYEASFHGGFRAKLGFLTEQDEDMKIAAALLDVMQRNHADFTLTFRRLADEADQSSGSGTTRTLFDNPDAFDVWKKTWQARLEREPDHDGERSQSMRRTSPLFIPRNHRVEEAIQAAVEAEDYQPFRDLLSVVTRPFDDHPELAHLAEPPKPHERVLQTFCGT